MQYQQKFRYIDQWNRTSETDAHFTWTTEKERKGSKD